MEKIYCGIILITHLSLTGTLPVLHSELLKIQIRIHTFKHARTHTHTHTDTHGHTHQGFDTGQGQMRIKDDTVLGNTVSPQQCCHPLSGRLATIVLIFIYRAFTQ